MNIRSAVGMRRNLGITSQKLLKNHRNTHRGITARSPQCCHGITATPLEYHRKITARLQWHHRNTAGVSPQDHLNTTGHHCNAAVASPQHHRNTTGYHRNITAILPGITAILPWHHRNTARISSQDLIFDRLTKTILKHHHTTHITVSYDFPCTRQNLQTL